MAENIKLIRQGGMNFDDAVEFIPQNDFIEAYNLRVTGTSEGEDGIGTNPESNVLITNTLQTGLNKAIGAAGFEVTRTAYSFIYNSQQYNVIAKLNYDANTQQNIFTNLTNSGGQNILDLDPEYYVNDIKLINDYLLAWTDGKNQPCITNLTRLEAGGYGVLTKDDFLIIKAQPMVVPVFEYGNDPTKAVNFLKNSLFQFMSQYVYLDNEYSCYSIMSKREVPTDETTPINGTSVIFNNVLIVSVNAGTNRVKTLNIVARISNLDFFLVRTIERAAILALPNSSINFIGEVREVYNPATNIYTFCFYNDGLYTNIDPLETDLNYDHVPLKCETLENVNGNLLALGGLTEGYPRPETDVLIQAVSYNPNIVTVPLFPEAALRVENWFQYQPDGVSYRKVDIYYKGLAETGDQFQIVTSNLIGVVYKTMTYTVLSSQEGNTEAAVRAFSATIPYSNVTNLGDTILLSFTTRRESETPDGGREQVLSTTVILSAAGSGQSESRPTLKSNSSYQAFLWYKDKWGRYFPICTDSRYIIKTPSYSQLQGLASMLSWQINHKPPVDAAYYGWGLSMNNTHQTTLWVQGVLDVANTTSAYFAFNINPLLKFNQANSSSVLNYEYSVGDRCTFVYYNIGSDTSTKTWLDKVDVEVVDFVIDVSTAEPPVTNYILKVRKPSSISQATLTGNNILLEIYTPKQRTEVVNGSTQYTEQLMYEIGISYPIVNGEHTVTLGEIKTGDTYIKSRQMVNGANLNQLDSLVVEDFNFSDFYPSAYHSYGKPRTFNDELGRVERKASIRHSEVFQRGSFNNGLNRFFPENIYGDSDGETSSNYGWIRKIRQRNNVLVVLQELKVGYVPVFQSVLEDQQATAQYAISFKIFNFVRYNGKNIGMGNAKESYAEWNNNIYFVDPFRSEPIRAGLDGVDTISGKMAKYFKKTLQEAYEAGKKLIGYYDIFYNEYLLTTETAGDILVSVPFNTLNWQLDDTYVIPAAGISITTNGTKGVATYNSTTGIATYTPNNGETGSDNFTFSFTPTGGVLTTKKVCITIQEGNTCGNIFTFGDIVGANLNQVYESNPILISGINIPAPISITGGGQYKINDGAFTSTSGTVPPDSNVIVRITSSATQNTAVSTTLTVGCRSDAFSVTTKDETPNPFAFTAVTNAELSTSYSSNVVTISGITGSVAISVTGGEYRINGGTYTSTAGTITNGQTVQVRRTSSASYETLVAATLTVGTLSSSYNITTRASATSYSYGVKFGTTTENVCIATPITVYSSSSAWGVEMSLYANADLTGYIGSFGYAVEPGTNNIWSLTSDGSAPLIVYSDTALDCSVGTNVTITACGTNPDISDFVTLYAYSNTAVDTNVSVQIQWIGSLSTELTGTAVITTGNSIGSITVGTAASGENYSSLEILSITPSSSSTQNYVEGSVSGGSCPT